MTFNHNGGVVAFDGAGTDSITCNGLGSSFNRVTFDTTGQKTVTSSCDLPVGDNPTISGGNGFVLNGTLSGSGTLTRAGNGSFLINSTGALSGFSGLVRSGAGALTIDGATMNFGSYTTFNVDTAFTISNGANITMPATAATFASTFTLNAGTTFNANGGTVTYDGTGTATLTCNGATFNLVSFTHTSGTRTVSSDCSLPLGNSPSAGSGGSITNNGLLSGSGNLATTGTFTLGTTGQLSGFSGYLGSSLTISGALDASSYDNFSVPSSFVLNSTGSLTAPSGTMNVGGGFTINAGATFTHNDGTVNFNGSTSSTISCANASFNLVTFTHTNLTKTVSSDCSLPLGNNPTVGMSNGSDISISGTLTGSGILTIASQNAGNLLTLGATGSLSGFSGLAAGSVTVSGGSYDFSGFGSFEARSNYTQSAGTVSIPDNADFNGSFTVSAGAVFTAATGDATFAEDFTLSAGATFNANGGTIIFDTSSSNHRTITCNGAVFNLVQFSHSAFRKTVSSGCTLPLGTDPTLGPGGGSVTLSGTLMGTGTLNATNTFTIESTGVVSDFTGLSAVHLTINGATLDFSGMTNTFYVSGNYTQTGGSITVPDGSTFADDFIVQTSAVFNAPSGLVTFDYNFTIGDDSTFNHNSGTVEFANYASDNSIISCGLGSFNYVVFTHTSMLKGVEADCTLPLGTDPVIPNGGDISLLGTLSGSGTLTVGGDLTMHYDPSTLSGFDGLAVNEDFNINDATKDFSTLTTLDLNGDFITQFNTVFTAPTAGMNIAGQLTLSNATTWNSGGTVTFDGSIDQSLLCQNLDLGTIAINKSDGGFVIYSDCNLPLGANPTINLGSESVLSVSGATLSGSGTLTVNGLAAEIEDNAVLSGFSGIVTSDDLQLEASTNNFASYTTFDVGGNFYLYDLSVFTAPSDTMSVGDEFYVESGSTFNHNNGTVVLNGTDQLISGATFNNLTKTVSSAATLMVVESETINIDGDLTLKGVSGQLLSLASSNPGTQWIIDVAGSHDIQYVSVTDSNNTGSTLTAYDSTDGGNNINWAFATTPDPDPGGGGDDDGGSDDTDADATDDDEAGTGDEEVSVSGSAADDETATDEDEQTDEDVVMDGGFPETTDNETAGSDNKSSSSKLKFVLIFGGIGGFSVLLWLLIAFLRKPGNDQEPPPLLP